MIAVIVWAAGFLAALAGLLAYIGIQTYHPSISCNDLRANAEKNGLGEAHPPDIDAWDNWELLCGYYERPSAP